MYDLVTKLKKIGDWDIVKNNLYAIQDNQVKKFNLKGEFINNIYTLKKYWGVNFYEDFFHIYTMYSENTFVDYNKRVLLEKDNFDFYHIFAPNRYIGFDRAIKKVINQDKVILFNERINLRSVISNYFIFTNKHKNIIFTIDLDHPTQPLWQYSIAHFPNYIDGFGNELPADIEQIIGIYNNLLWVLLGGDRLIALNVKNGNLEHNIKNIVRGMGDIHLDEQKGVLKILGGHTYEEFDLNKLVLTEKFKDENIFFRSCNFYPKDDNLYFCAVNNCPDNSKYNAFGIFNTIQNKVIWLQEQQDDWGLSYNPPQANQKQLAILDNKGNLLVFDKEEIMEQIS